MCGVQLSFIGSKGSGGGVPDVSLYISVALSEVEVEGG